MYRSFYSILAMTLCTIAPSIASAVVIYSDDFNADTSANYNTFVTAGATGPSGDSTFVYNYGADPASGGLAPLLVCACGRIISKTPLVP